MKTKWSKRVSHAGLTIGIAMFLWAQTAAAATLQVGTGQTYSTIQAAVTAATAGDTIQVAAGTYTEQILVAKDVTINGANAGIAAGNKPGTRGAETIVDGGFIVSAAGATIVQRRSSSG